MALDTRISLHKLAVFSLVVELGSVSRAAERLMVSQPVVSAHLRSLEEALGCTLVEARGGRRSLSEPGAAVYRWAQETLRATRELERELAVTQGSGGVRIVLAASMSLGSYRLARVLAGFLVAHPEVDVHEQIADLGRIVDATAAGSIDFGLVVGEVGVRNQELQVQLIGREALVLVGAPAMAEGLAPLAPEALAEMSLIEGHGGDGSDEVVRRALSAARVRRRVALELGHPEAVKGVVREGGCVAFLPRSAAAAELERGELSIIAVDGLSLDVPVHLLTRAGRDLSPLERELVDALRADYRDQQASA